MAPVWGEGLPAEDHPAWLKREAGEYLPWLFQRRCTQYMLM